MTDEVEADKLRTIQHIQNLYAFELFQQHRFEESMKMFAKLGTGKHWREYDGSGSQLEPTPKPPPPPHPWGYVPHPLGFAPVVEHPFIRFMD